MAVVTLPTFSDNEIVTPEKLNALVAALNAKFSGGFDASDLQWPLEAEGDLAMGIYNITGARKIAGVINAANYPDLQTAVTAAGTGGCVFVPPDTTVTANGVTFTGDGVAIVGAGPSSEILLTAGTTGSFLLRSSGTTVHSGFLMSNLTLNGNASTGASNVGLQLQYVRDAVIHAVIFKGFSGAALELTNNGTAGNGCARVSVTHCSFSGGAGHHILSDDVTDFYAFGNTCEDNATAAIHLEADAANCKIKRVKIHGNNISSGANPAIFVAGDAAATSENWSDISVMGNTADTMTGAAPTFQIGTTGGGLLRVSVCDNSAPSAALDGLSICADYGTVRGNILHTAGGDGIDLTESVMLDVSDNDVRTATVNGIDAHLSVSCTVHDNRTQSSAVPILRAATLRQWANGDTVGAVPYTAYVNPTSVAGGGGGEAVSCIVAIPANSLRVGDVLRARGIVTGSGTADAGNCYIYYKATGGSDQVIASCPMQAGTFNIEGTMVITAATVALAMSTGIMDANTVVDRVVYSTGLTVNLATAAQVYLRAVPHASVTANARFLLVERSTAEVQ